MTSGFQQQKRPGGAFSPPRAVPTPQHGQKADKSCIGPPVKRLMTPRPAH